MLDQCLGPVKQHLVVIDSRTFEKLEITVGQFNLIEKSDLAQCQFAFCCSSSL